ncbi:MAG TPA: MmcQ/YjbR family DNA-binding protein [Fimbriimonadaceae bacterium]|nr:MmcQ/YjbR family DNA-binding protein [Fimbriimonadaceae bacterium]
MNPYFERIRDHCLAKAKAFEDHPWGETVFKVAPKGKIFCFCGSEGPAITVKSTLEKQAALIQDPNIEVAAYVGRHGWVTVHLREPDMLDLALDLIDESYDMIASKPKAKPRK